MSGSDNARSVIGTDPYEALGVGAVINCEARLTVLGGSLMPPEVVSAMTAAARQHVDMHELLSASGNRLAELTHNEAAYVTTGAAAGMALAVMAAMTGNDLSRVTRFPKSRHERDEVVIHRAHFVPYVPAVRLARGRLVGIGSLMSTSRHELEGAIGPRTACVLYVAGKHLSRAALPLREVVEVAHARGVPVVVDAAAQLPPASNLWSFTRDDGADIAIFSGGKDLEGPQSSGLVVGTSEMVSAIDLHGAPRQHYARALKVGKEEIVGLVAAVERYVRMDHGARERRWAEVIAVWQEALSGLSGVSCRLDADNQAGQPLPRLLVRLDPSSGLPAPTVRAQLRAERPSVAVGLVGADTLSLTPEAVVAPDEHVVSERLVAALGRRCP